MPAKMNNVRDKVSPDEILSLTANARLMAMTVMEEARIARLRQDIAQAELARRMGVNQSTISEWETGVVMPQLDSLMALCIVLEIPMQFGSGFSR